jgi:hypothetical protein
MGVTAGIFLVSILLRDALSSVYMISMRKVDKVSCNWKCSQENVQNINKGNGGHCQVKRNGYLSDSEMTVTYRCSEPPKRDIEEFVKGNGNKGSKW